MSKIVTIAAGFYEYSKNMTSVYEDMHGHWAESYVELADVLNIVKGITPTKYGPDIFIKFEEAYTMVIRLLGYSDESLGGNWPSNYYKKALELNLFENIETGKEFATRKDVSIMLYNAMSLDLVKVRENKTTYSTGKTLLSLLGKKETKEINFSDLRTENFDFTSYLFNKWDIYYDLSGNIVYVTNPRYNEFKGKVTSLLSNRVIFVTDDYGNVRAFQLPDIPVVINGEKGSFNNLNNCKISVVYEDDSFNGDVVGIIAFKETDIIVVNRDSLYKKDNKSFAGKSLPLKHNEEINYNKLHIYGDAASLEDIKVDDVVYFYENANKITSLTLNVVRKQTEGLVTDIQEIGNSIFYTVNSISYKTSDNFIFTEKASINDKVKLILDKNNYIIKLNILSYGKNPSTFGIVLGASNSVNESATVRIFDEYGGLKTYNLSDNSSVVNVTDTGKELIKKTNLKRNDIVKFDPTYEAIKIINYIPSQTYIANNYNQETMILSNGYWISSNTFIVYEKNGKYQLLKPNQLDTYLEGKAAVGYNSHIDALFLNKGIKAENQITITPGVPQTFNGKIYGIIKGVTKIDDTTSHVQFFNNSNVFSVSNSSVAGKKISSVINSYIKADIVNGIITGIEKVTPETDKVKITQIYSNQFLIDSITYMEYTNDLKVYLLTQDKSGNITSYKEGSKNDIKAGSIVQLYDLYGGFDGIIDVVDRKSVV